MTTRPRKRKRKVAARKPAKKSAGRAAAKKAPAKKKPKAKAKPREKKPPRRRAPAKAKPKSSAPQSARRGGTPGRHLLTSLRRPKVQAKRGPSRARVVAARRHQVKRTAVRDAAAAGAPPALSIRDFAPDDAAAVNAAALAAFAQYRGEYDDWPTFSASIGSMADRAQDGELIVALSDGRVAGAVAYVGPQTEKPAMFDAGWPIIRMLVVDPEARGRGLGRMLTDECIRRARRDGAKVIALHTSPIMQVALAMYLRLGFVPLRDAPRIHGVPYRIYLKRL